MAAEGTASAAESKFARKLASNEAKVRNRALKRLRMYLTIRSKNDGNFDHLEMLKLWKGLYFCMWMADKPLVQEDLADNMASLLHCFHTTQQALMFLQVFYETMSREWALLDRLRLDKFMMLIRKFFRGSLELLKRKKWDKQLAEDLAQCMEDGPLNPKAANVPEGLQNHLSEVFVAEVKAVADPELSPDVLGVLLSSFLQLMAQTKRANVHDALCKGLFEALLRSAETGLQMTRKGQKPNLRIDCQLLADQLLQKAIDRDTLGRNRKALYELKKKFQDMAVASGLSEPEAAVVEEEEVSLGEPSYSKDALGRKKKKKKKKEWKGVQENGDCMFEEQEEVLDKEAALSKGHHWKEKRKPKRAKGSSTTTSETGIVSEQVKRGGRKRQASSRRTDLPQAEGMISEEEISEPKTKISTPEEFEGGSLGLFTDLSTGDWGSSNGGEGEAEMAAEAALTPTALVHRKSKGTRRMKKGKVKHVKVHKAGRVASLAAAHTSDSVGMDGGEIAEEGGNGGWDGVKSVSPSKRVSFKPQQLYTVQEFLQDQPVSPHIKPLAEGCGSSQTPPTKPFKGIVKSSPTVSVLARQTKRLKAADFF